MKFSKKLLFQQRKVTFLTVVSFKNTGEKKSVRILIMYSYKSGREKMRDMLH